MKAWARSLAVGAMHLTWASIYLVARVVGLLIAMAIFGTVIGAIIGIFKGPGTRGILHGASVGASTGIGVGLFFFAWGILIAVRNAARGDYRRLREQATAERLQHEQNVAHQ